MNFSEKLPFPPDDTLEKQNQDDQEIKKEDFSEKLPSSDNTPEKQNPDDQGIKKEKGKKESREKKELELYVVEITEQCSSGGKIIIAFTRASSIRSAQYNVMVNYNIERGYKKNNFVKMKRPVLWSSMSKEEREKHHFPVDIQLIGELPGTGVVLFDGKEYHILETGQNAIYKATEEQLKEIQSSLLKK